MRKSKSKSKSIIPPIDQSMIVLAPSREDRGRFFTLLGILAAVIVALFLLQDRSKPEPNSAETIAQSEDSPDAIIEKFHLVSTFKGVKRWEFYSDMARLYQAQKLAYTDNVYAQYYKKEKLVSTLTADKAIINTETNETQAQGHVELIVENGSKLETEKLDWNPDTDQIKTDEKVHVYKGSDEITAVGMTADTELNNIHFSRDVHSKVRDVNDITDFQKPKPF
jgi:LPS export ABC transporter protein LptC